MSPSEVIHFFYFLSEDQEPLEKAWQQIVRYYNLLEVAVSHCDEGPLLSRFAEMENVSLALSVLEHLAIVELRLHEGDWRDNLADLGEVRTRLGDVILDMVGESSCIIQQEKDVSVLGKKSITIELPKENQLMVAHAPEKAGKPRLYLLVSSQPEEARRFLLKNLVPLDSLSYQIQRQMAYYQVQHDSFLEQEDELNGKIGKSLYRKETDLPSLEGDVEKTAEIYALMTNYSVLLNSSQRILRGDLQRLEALVRKGLHQREDPYFVGRHGARLKEFIGVLEASQRNFSRSLDNAKAAIDVMKSRVDLGNSRITLGLQQQLGSLMHQNVAIQEETLVMGMAATMVEFFVVLYYGLGVWKMLAGEEVVHHIPVLLKSGLIVAFSLAVVAGTHKAAQAIKEKTIKGVLVWGGVMLAMIALMAGVSALYGH